MLKILHLVNYIYPQIGGVGITAMDIAQSLKGEYEQQIICINYNLNDDGILLDTSKTIRHKVKGIDVTRCKMNVHIASQAISLHFIEVLKRRMEDYKPDIVIFHYPNPYMAHFLLKYRNRTFKMVLWWHSDIIKQKFLRIFFVGQNYRLLNRAEVVIATSENYIGGSDYLSKYKGKCKVIPSCIDEKRDNLTSEDRNRAEMLRKRGKTICFAVGRHVPYKGFEYLIDAGQYLDDSFVFYIGGSGPETKALKKRAKEDGRFIFVGHLSEKELRAYYCACDIFCFPSITKNEAFGLALADALYYGKPAITFRIPGSGVNFVNVHGVTGLEVTNRDSKAYAKALIRLSKDDELRKKMGKEAHKRADDLFTYAKYRNNVREMIDGLC